MLIDLLSSSNYVNFNIKLAHIIGLKPSIYLSQIMDINEKAIRKNKINQDYFTIDRKYVEERTTLTKDEQISIEKTLLNIGVLKKSAEHKNTISLDITTLTSIMMTPDEDLIKDITDLSRSRDAKSHAKSKAIENSLKDNVLTTNVELRDAYYEWIESVLTKDGYMTKAAVTNAQIEIDRFSKRNLDVALAILRNAATNGYRDVTWSINNFIKDQQLIKQASDFSNNVLACKSESNDSVAKLRVGSEVF